MYKFAHSRDVQICMLRDVQICILRDVQICMLRDVQICNFKGVQICTFREVLYINYVNYLPSFVYRLTLDLKKSRPVARKPQENLWLDILHKLLMAVLK